VAVILILLSVGNAIERSLRDEMRQIWEDAIAGTPPTARQSWVATLRTSPAYQRFIYAMKWIVLPDVVIAPLTVVVAVCVLFAGYVQAWVAIEDNSMRFCTPSSSTPITSTSRDFDTRDLCSASFGQVTKGNRYTVTFDVLTPWRDSSLDASPLGLSASQFRGPVGYVFAPLKRVINAKYLQPLIEIRPVKGAGGTLSNVQIYPLAVEAAGDSPTVFRADFTAARDGELFLFVNDAMLPFPRPVWRGFDYKYFYENNDGTARVTVASDDAPRASARAR